jgi:hypothetical protein
LSGLVVVLLIGIPLVGLLLVVLADLVPDRLIVDQLLIALDNGSLPREDYGTGWTGHQVDQFTDCLGLTIGLGDLPGTNMLSSAIENPTLGKCTSAVPRLEGYQAGDGLSRSYEYYRYWHGYTVPIRPLVASVGLRGTRILTAAVLVVGILGFARSLAQRHGPVAPVVLLAPLVLTTDFADLPASLPHAYGVVAILGTCWLAYVAVVSRATLWRAAVVSGFSGAVVVYTDILTTAPAGWALCVFVVTLAASTLATGSRLAAFSGTSAVSWIVGYGWMWFSKWILAALIYGYDEVRRTIGANVSNRLDGEYVDIEEGVLASTRVNVSQWWAQPLSGAVLVAIVAVIVAVWIRRIRDDPGGDRRVLDRLILSSAALIPVVWYETLRNHSQVHFWFTYRAVSVVIGIIAAASVVRMVERSAMLQLEHTDDEAENDEFGADCDGGNGGDHDPHGLGRVESLE